MFDENYNLILRYSKTNYPRWFYFKHNTYFEELFFELMLNSDKIGIIYAVYWKMRKIEYPVMEKIVFLIQVLLTDDFVIEVEISLINQDDTYFSKKKTCLFLNIMLVPVNL